MMLGYSPECTRSERWIEMNSPWHTHSCSWPSDHKNTWLWVCSEKISAPISALWLIHLSAAPAGSSAERLVCVTFLNSTHTRIHTQRYSHTPSESRFSVCPTQRSRWTPTPACGRKTLIQRSKTVCVSVCVCVYSSVCFQINLSKRQSVSIHL